MSYTSLAGVDRWEVFFSFSFLLPVISDALVSSCFVFLSRCFLLFQIGMSFFSFVLFSWKRVICLKGIFAACTGVVITTRKVEMD